MNKLTGAARSTCWTCGAKNRTTAHPAFNCDPENPRLLAARRETQRRMIAARRNSFVARAELAGWQVAE